MTDRCIKSDAGRDGKPPRYGIHLRRADVKRDESSRIEDNIQCLKRTGRDMQGTGKIIPGTGGDVAERYLFRIFDAVYYFIYRPVAA